jgi:hypothetical protein
MHKDYIDKDDCSNMNAASLLVVLNDFINFKRSIPKGLLTCKLEIRLSSLLQFILYLNTYINSLISFETSSGFSS